MSIEDECLQRAVCFARSVIDQIGVERVKGSVFWVTHCSHVSFDDPDYDDIEWASSAKTNVWRYVFLPGRALREHGYPSFGEKVCIQTDFEDHDTVQYLFTAEQLCRALPPPERVKTNSPGGTA